MINKNESSPPQDKRPDWVKKNEVGKNEVEFEGQKIPYTILRKEVEPKLPGFLGFPEGKFLFISEEVPEEFRNPQLVHEIIEFTELKGKKGRCLESMKRELEIVPDDIKKEYIEYRRNFFGRLIEYSKNSDDEDFKKEIQASYDYLQSQN